MEELENTGFCWACGLQCKDLFCNDKCKKIYTQKTNKQNYHQIKHGKRENYGVTGI